MNGGEAAKTGKTARLIPDLTLNCRWEGFHYEWMSVFRISRAISGDGARLLLETSGVTGLQW